LHEDRYCCILKEKKTTEADSSSDDEGSVVLSVRDSDSDNEFLENLRNPSPEISDVEQVSEVGNGHWLSTQQKQTNKPFIGQITSQERDD
jgi:predicted RND superfamily exporter protein